MAADAIHVTKRCTKCSEIKPITEFSKAATGAHGVRGDCKPCRRSMCKAWYCELPDERKRARQSREGKKEWQAAYYRRNKEYFSDRAKRWLAENRDRHRASTRQAMRRRRATAKGKLESNIGRAVYRALKSGKNRESSFRLLNFTAEDLIKHLERQFTKGMTWENYGTWHVDHIRPLASFEYEKPSDPAFKDAWALTNLRPLWAKENISKGAKRSLLV